MRNSIYPYFVLLLLMSLGMLTACGGDTTSEGNPTSPPTSVLPTGTQVTSSQPTSIPTSEFTPEPALSMIIWWPDQLIPSDADVLDQQIRAFVNAEDRSIDIEFRIKTTEGPGSIISTLSSAHQVAQGILPDITLVRRSDLITAIQDDLIIDLEGAIPTAILSDLYDSALILGQVDNTIYGLAYMVDVQMGLYQPTSEINQKTRWSYEDVLDYNARWAFPAQRDDGISRVFYLQYLSAGGTPLTGITTLTNEDIAALERTLTFYEQALEQDVLDDDILSYRTSADYLEDLQRGDYAIAAVTSSDYFQLVRADTDLQPAMLPIAADTPVSQVNGWLWVITTSDDLRQEIALDFLNWMMDTNRHAEFSTAVMMLPAQESVLRLLEQDIDITLIDSLLQNTTLPLPQGGGSIGRAMQNALIAVINGNLSAEEATENIATQFGPG